ncbi:hypothetical protein ACYPKM_03180 [Pseudomonas aeruginosa]
MRLSRHRRVINLYDNKPQQEELLNYLNQFDQAMQSQQLVQMALIGFRVMLRQESGEEAYFRVRNPDLPQSTGRKVKAIPTQHEPRQTFPVASAVPRREYEEPAVVEPTVVAVVAPVPQNAEVPKTATPRKTPERSTEFVPPPSDAPQDNSWVNQAPEGPSDLPDGGFLFGADGVESDAAETQYEEEGNTLDLLRRIKLAQLSTSDSE